MNFDWLKDRLVADWCTAWKWWSLRLHIAATAVLFFVNNNPTLMQQVVQYIPDELLTPFAKNAGLALWLLLGAFARVYQQKSKASA